MHSNCEKCSLRLLGGLVVLISASTFGLGIADVVVTWLTCDHANNCDTTTNSLLLAWIAVGIWASIPIFIAGVVTLWISTHISTNTGWLTLLSIMSCLLFAPALVVISALELYYTYPDGLPAAPAIDKPRFGIPLAVGIGGIILLLLVFIVFVYACRRSCCQQQQTYLDRPTIQTVSAHVHLQQQQPPAHVIDDPDKMKMRSAYRWVQSDVVGGQQRMARPVQPPPANYYDAGAPPMRSSSVGAGSLYAGVVSAEGGYYPMPRAGQPQPAPW